MSKKIQLDAITCPKCGQDAETVLLIDLEMPPDYEIVDYTGVNCKACGYVEPSDKERIREFLAV